MDSVLITTIGKREEYDFEKDLFLYNKQYYQKLLIWDKFDKLANLRLSGFYLSETTVNDEIYLTLRYSPSFAKASKSAMNQREEIIYAFFEFVDGPQQLQQDTQAPLTIDNFYERLKEAHEKESFESIKESVQHPSLKSTTRLRSYQVKGIKWMLKRELETDYLSHNFVLMQSKVNPELQMYFNRSTKEFLSQIDLPKNKHVIPSGGLLCDEMGLGKTVEMITLILMNPRPQTEVLQTDKINFEDIPLSKIKTLLNPSRKKELRKCICHSIQKNRNEDLIVCSECFSTQHKRCVKAEGEEFYNYICPTCWKLTNRIIEASTTLIVSPTSIKKQWQSEVQRHIVDENFKVLVYNGIGSGWISPVDLAKYDVIITDFATLGRELYYAETIDRQLRQDKKFEYPPSPLTHVRWWRVIIDEAQMVENATNRPSKMVKTLPAVHRWGCTGTPIERGSIQHLYGLIYFLDIHPYTDFNNFNCLWIDYRNGKPDVLVNFLAKIMWRTCKKDVEHEIEIPPQQELIHYIEMSNLQKCFYVQVHQSTKPEFAKFILNYISHYDREKKQHVPDNSLKDKALYELDNATINTLLEPLRKLRQDCTIANLFSSDQTKVKQTLHADQLHDHLVKKTTIECKSALRTICSSLNGIAALKIAEEKYDEAIGLYKQVLRFAKDYNAPNGVHVDSMLQIHSYSSLIEMAMKTQNESELAKKEEYSVAMMTLEWKYIRNYYDKVQSINEEIREYKDEYKKAMREYTDHDGYWWIDVTRTYEDDNRLADLINAEFFSGFVTGAGAFAEQIRSTRGIQLVISEWISKIGKYSKIIKKQFKDFDFIIKNLKPSNELDDESNEKISRIAKAALDCHLNLFEENDEEELAVPKNPALICDLCKLKKKLDEYECVLFNKTLVNNIVEGTWNPRMEERLLKVIFNFAKRTNCDEEDIEMGKNFFNYLEALKKDYKSHAQLWVELNYTVAAYDELNMCKTRMQVVDSVDEISEEDAKFRLKITRYEIEDQIGIFMSQKQEGETQFTRLNGRLKYLDHLKEEKNPTCIICTTEIQERYYVTVCGHSLCAECFLTLTKEKRRFSTYERMKINCPLCRTQQELGSILRVTCRTQESSSSDTIIGNYSPKIDEIIRCVLRLRRDEPDVKILIFSQWDSILTAIIQGLKENSIGYRSSFGTKFSQQIEEFKDYTKGVTCMMLNLKFAGKGLNLTEATHVFFVEPILNADEEMQAVGRIHRIGQTRETFVHKFITKETIEESLFNKIIQEREKWIHKKFTIRDLENLFLEEISDEYIDII